MTRPAETRASWRPVVTTLLCIAAYQGCAFIPLPGINTAALRTGTFADLSRCSVAALGVLPWFSALTMVEAVALLLPRSLAHYITIDGHAVPFGKLVILLALVLAAFQGYGVTEAMRAMPGLVSEDTSSFSPLAIASLVAGTAVAIALARIIERHGTGYGFWVLLAATILFAIGPSIANIYRAMILGSVSEPVALAILVLPAVILAGVCALLELRWRSGVRDAEVVIWPFVLTSIYPNLLIFAADLFVGETSAEALDQLASFVTDRSIGTIAGFVIGILVYARYISFEKSYRFLLPGFALILLVILVTEAALRFVVPPPLFGASAVIVAAVAYTLVRPFLSDMIPTRGE